MDLVLEEVHLNHQQWGSERCWI